MYQDTCTEKRLGQQLEQHFMHLCTSARLETADIAAVCQESIYGSIKSAELELIRLICFFSGFSCPSCYLDLYILLPHFHTGSIQINLLFTDQPTVDKWYF